MSIKKRKKLTRKKTGAREGGEQPREKGGCQIKRVQLHVTGIPESGSCSTKREGGKDVAEEGKKTRVS